MAVKYTINHKESIVNVSKTNKNFEINLTNKISNMVLFCDINFMTVLIKKTKLVCLLI